MTINIIGRAIQLQGDGTGALTPYTPPPAFTVYSDADYPPVPTADRPKSVQRTVAGIGAVNSGASDSNDGILVADGGTGPWATWDYALQQVCNPANGIRVLNIDGTVVAGSSSWTKYYGAGTGAAGDFFWVRSLPGTNSGIRGDTRTEIDGPDYWLWFNLHMSGELGIEFGKDLPTTHQQVRNCTGTMTGAGNDNSAFFVWKNSNSTYAGAFNCNFDGPGVAGIHGNTSGLLAFKVNSLRWENNRMANFPRPYYFKHSNEGVADVHIRNNWQDVGGDSLFTGYANGGVFEVTNNIFKDGLFIGNIGGGVQPNGMVFDHNTVGGILYVKEGNNDPINCSITNSIQRGTMELLRYAPDAPNTNATNYNLYGGLIWYNGSSYSLASWQASSVPAGQDVNSLAGTPTFVGGASPTTVAGWALASGAGVGASSTGTDMGADVSKVGVFI